MKRYIGKYLVLLCGLLALAPMSGCKLDDPEIPVEELFLRNFIKEYGLIDPNQDFSSAEQTNVTLHLPSRASTVNVYAQVGDSYYRVGCFADLKGTVKVPVDVSEATEGILLDIDGVRYNTMRDGVVYVKSAVHTARIVPDPYAEVKSLWIDPAEWNSVTAINGETEETVGARVPVVIGNDGKMTGSGLFAVGEDKYFDVTKTAYVGENLEKGSRRTKLGDHNNLGEVGNTSDGTNVRFLIDNTDNTLSAYRFIFRTASRNDAKVRVVILGQHKSKDDDEGLYVFMDSGDLTIESNQDGSSGSGTYDTSVGGKYTEWEIRTELMPKGKYELIIMGVESTRNADGNQYCGNWGFMRIDRLKTATDMRWILACEDLGTTDDFDFNDVVLSVEAINTNRAALDLNVLQWQVVENLPGDNGGTVLHKAPSRDDSDANINSENLIQLKVTALAAGGTLPIWLHFREKDGTDYLVLPWDYKESDPKGNWCLKEAKSLAKQEVDNEKAGSGPDLCGEWHRWFGIDNSTDMLNTGLEKHRDGKSVIFYTSNEFSLENFCYLKFDVEVKDGTSYPYLDGNQDPWAQKVLEWQWQQAHSQEVTFGFFLTVYHPLVNGTESISDKDTMKGHILSKSLPGLPPQMMLLPDCNPLRGSGYVEDHGWMWPCERVRITKVYPNFSNWVGESNSFLGVNWFMIPQAGILDSDKLLYPRDPDRQKAFEPFKLDGYKDDKDTDK